MHAGQKQVFPLLCVDTGVGVGFGGQSQSHPGASVVAYIGRTSGPWAATEATQIILNTAK